MSDDTTQGADKDFLEATVKAIVDHPEAVIAERSVDDLGVLIKLRVHEEDMSKVVGKSGQTAKALRTLLRLVGSKFDQRVNLKILEPDGSEHRSERSENATPKEETPKVEKEATPPKEDSPKKEEGKEGEEAGEAFENVI